MLIVNLRHLMADRKIDNYIDIMKIAGISRGTIRKLQREENVASLKLDTLLLICDALNCKLSELIEYIPDEK